jgi:alpha-L-fucosidase
MDEYLSKKAYPQVEELMKNYKIDLLWFDTPAGMKPEQGRRFLEIVRKNNPDCLTNSRLLYWPKEEWKPEQLEFFDYVSLEDKEVPPHKLPLTTESPDSVSTSYGYKAHGAVRYHTLQEIIHRFVHTVCGGGNYLLNFGPMGNGKVDPKALELFHGVGAWIKDNGASIYGTQANPLPDRPAWGDANLSKDGKTLYLHVMKWPADGKLTVDGVAAKATSVTFLSPKAANRKVKFTQNGAALKISLPGQAVDLNDTVLNVLLETCPATTNNTSEIQTP